MDLIVNYDYYDKEFFGNIIPLNEFDNYIKRAISKVDYFTFNRINENNVNNGIRDGICIIAELLFKQDKLKNQLLSQDNNSQKISSETLGPRSITYSDNTQYQDKHIKSDEELKKSIHNICKEYIDAKFLYRGV